MKRILKLLLPSSSYLRLKSLNPMQFRQESYSQEGEDRILARLFGGVQKGFFVDVGAHHPKRFSNTYLLSKRGWRGINIEPNLEQIQLFQKYRPQDLNLCVGISSESGVLDYYSFNEPAINTFDKATSERLSREGIYKLVEKKQIKILPLAAVLNQAWSKIPKPPQIDFLNVDVENHEFEVIFSNDWVQYQPSVICIEIHAQSLEEFLKNRTYKFLHSHGYRFLAKTPMTSFFVLEDFKY